MSVRLGHLGRVCVLVMKKCVLVIAKQQFVAKDLVVERGCMANDVCAAASALLMGKIQDL